MKRLYRFFAFILFLAILMTTICVTAFASATPELNTGLVDIAGIYVGENHVFVLQTDGDIVAWGKNNFGQLGNGTNADSNNPVTLQGLSVVAKVSAGSNHSLILKNDGDVYSCGNNSSGQLGNGTKVNSNVPIRVNYLFTMVSVSAGEKHSIALKSDGTVWAWGDNTYGQLGDGTTQQRTSPVQVPGLHSIVAIAAGANHSLALQADGTVWTWGDNRYGQLGDGTTVKSTVPKSINISNVANSIAAGANHSVAVSSYGDVYTWGSNIYGQLGDGTNVQRNNPVKVTDLPVVSGSAPSFSYGGRTVNLVQNGVAAGANHTLAITPSGDVYAWGRNSEGQLGDGTTINKNVPIQVSSLLGCSYISAGGNRSFAIKSAIDVYQWGGGASVSTPAATQPTKPTVTLVNVTIDGNPLNFTTSPRLISGKSMVPVRDIIEGLGVTLVWDPVKKTISGTKGNNTVVLKEGSNIAVVNGQNVTMEVPVQIIEGRAFGQVRTIAEGLGAKVDWNGSTNTVVITTK